MKQDKLQELLNAQTAYYKAVKEMVEVFGQINTLVATQREISKTMEPVGKIEGTAIMLMPKIAENWEKNPRLAKSMLRRIKHKI